MIRTPMPRHRVAAVLPTSLVLLLTLLFVGASPALAATAAQKLSVLSGWTQTSAASATAFNAARLNRTPWASYGFDWSTDVCSASPDKPLGFDFTQPCRRHDFGYRNYKAMKLFSTNKARVDDAFYADLRRTCARYAAAVRPACLSLAWTYYKAVHLVGALVVSKADLAAADRMKADGLRAEQSTAGSTAR